MMLPILDKFAEEYGDKVKVCKVNVDEAPELAAQFRVMSIPTLVVLKDGEIFKAPEAGIKQIKSNDGKDLITFCGL